MFDPTFYLKFVEHLENKINTISNPQWKFYPKIEHEVEKHISKNLLLLKNIE